MSKLFMLLRDWWHISLMGRHKHDFSFKGIRATKGANQTYKIPLYSCSCGKTLMLDDWQMQDLPWQMQYGKYGLDE